MRNHYNEISKQCRENRTPVIITVNGRGDTNPFNKVGADSQFIEICDTFSIGASIENMLLKATEIGLGTLWIANTCYAYKELTGRYCRIQTIERQNSLGYNQYQFRTYHQ